MKQFNTLLRDMGIILEENPYKPELRCPNCAANYQAEPNLVTLSLSNMTKPHAIAK